MIKRIAISNFRSLKEQSITLKKINILYGPNGSGKSSVMYAPYVMRNFMVDPNQRLDSFFNLGFINLGGFDNVVRTNPARLIKIALDCSPSKDYVKIVEKSSSALLNFSITLSNTKALPSSVDFKYQDEQGLFRGGFGAGTVIDFPYSLTSKTEIEVGNYKLLWNGLTFEMINNQPDGFLLVRLLNSLYSQISNLEFIPVKRGFFNPIFSTEKPNEESEFALSIRQQESDFESKIDHYFKKIFDKTFRFVAIPGSTSFYLRTQNKNGLTVDLVNEGFGVNQAVYMLINLLKQSTSLAFIEEPEIHLHPSAQSKLVDTFTEIALVESKQIFLTTHSENIVSSFLGKIAKNELSVDDIQFYFAQVENGETKIIPQNVNAKGQIEGGLLSFMQAEIESLKSILGL